MIKIKVFCFRLLNYLVRHLMHFMWRGANTWRDVCGGVRFAERQLFPGNVKLDIKRMSPYFSAYGYKVPLSYGEAYAKWTGIASDRYMSMDVYYQYAIPALNRYDFINALTDKGGYSILFRDVKQPKAIVKNRNGIYYSATDRVISFDDAIAVCDGLPEDQQYIIKPTVATACGRGIGLLEHASRSDLEQQFVAYRKDFIVQEKLSQHAVMASFNGSSLNTLRLYTYRDVNKKIHFVDECAIVRIGGKGAIKDNVSSGGGLCSVSENGEVSDRFLREKTYEVGSLREEKGLKDVVIPNYAEAKNFVMDLHNRLPYFDWIGWDVAIDTNGECVFIEFNVVPFIEGPQMAHGPMFGPYLDEVMSRISGVNCVGRVARDCEFSNGYRRIDHVVTY